MPEMGTSGLMSGGGKRGGATASVPAPILDSTLRPTSTSACPCSDRADPVARRAGPGGPAQTWRSAPQLLAAFPILGKLSGIGRPTTMASSFSCNTVVLRGGRGYGHRRAQCKLDLRSRRHPLLAQEAALHQKWR